MKRAIALLLLFHMLLSSLPCEAQVAASSSVQDIPTGADKIVPLRKGAAAPYDGQFFDNDTALRWGNWLLQYKYRLGADVALEHKLGEADTKLWQQKYDIIDQKYVVVTTDYQKQVAALRQEVIDLQNPPWYRTPIFGFVVGVIFTGLTVGVGAYALHNATK